MIKHLTQLQSVHIVGICGTLMGAFAAYLKRQGTRVTGSDQNVYPPMSEVLAQAGVQLFSGYRSSNIESLIPKPDLVVIGNVIRSDNPEAVFVREAKLPFASLPETMEKLLLAESRNLVVAGTHGKTTTSSWLAFVLDRCGRDPSYFIGGVSTALPSSFHVAESHGQRGALFVLEGDEYDTAFWDKVPKFNHYLPDSVILTSVEFDHADIYADLEAVIRAFEGLMDRVRNGGRVIACSDYPSVERVLKKSKHSILRYGQHSGECRVSGLTATDNGITEFDLRDADGKKITRLRIRLPGMHNALNATAVWLECRELGLELGRVEEALLQFTGVRRRQEERGEVAGVLVIDDFAHHPTAVRETLASLALKYSSRLSSSSPNSGRLIAVFEPRSATSRRKIFQQAYSEAFDAAQEIWIAQPYDQSRIAAEDQFSSEELVKSLMDRGKRARTFTDVDQGANDIAESVHEGDVIAVLSNGGFGGLIGKLLASLR